MLFFLNLSQFFLKSKNIHLNINNLFSIISSIQGHIFYFYEKMGQNMKKKCLDTAKCINYPNKLPQFPSKSVNTCVCKRGDCKTFISLSYNFHVFDWFGRERTGFVCMFIRTFFIENTTYLYRVSGYLKKIPLKNKEFRFLAPYRNLCSKTLNF